MEAELKSLVSERGMIKAALTRLKKFFKELTAETSIGSLQKRLEANLGLYDNFNRVQSKIELFVMGTEAAAAHEIEREGAAAARVIQSLGISDANYKLARDALKTRYEDSTTLLKHHVNALLDLAPVSKQSRATLREFIDDANNHLAALQSLASPTEVWDTLVVQILSRKLDVISLREWEKQIVGAGGFEWRSQGSGVRKFERLTTHVSSASSQCSCCRGNHPLYKCDKFKKLNLNDKKEIVQNSQRCYKCLETGHRVQNCTRRNCSICDRRHHSLLHRDSKIKHTEKENDDKQELSPNTSQQSCIANIASDSVDYTILSTAIVSAISVPTNIFLANSHFDSCRRVDMLVGAGLFWKVLCVGQHKAGPELLWQKTQFGWVLGGKLTWPASHAPNLTNRCNLQVVTNSELQGQLERFWKIEELPRTNNQIDDCEAHFLETAHRDSSGRSCINTLSATPNFCAFPLKPQLAVRRALPGSAPIGEPEYKQITAKMYRQVLVEVKDRRIQRILWRRNTTDPIQTYELNTVTYGTASATFLATRVLHQVGLECAERLLETSRIIINDFYVDDLLTGTETILDAQKLRDEITNILEQAGFQLRKWVTNSPNILKNNLEPVEEKEISIDKDPKTLGLLWSPDEDLLRFSLSFEKHRRVTKRVILSEIAQIFDPLGIIGPIITRAKIIMQELWQLKTGWDESISQELHTQWQQYRNDLQELVSLKIPRGVAMASQDNPADMISRGTAPSFLASADIWWAGPAWLSMDCKHWPESKIQTVDAPEERQALEVGTLVLIKEDNLPPLRWRLGRIKELHLGTDGGARVATVKTADGIFKRPVAKLCMLPIEDTDSKSDVNDSNIDKI
ncbi:uncharacterized protein LOC117225086 [Megalopta genalis]|uniref:uncharacterized protein LOC117225086 n=1 Tax=Megalopta genalis TaxID=115081 RepID=UPI003FCFEBE5